jgi:arabinofuranosyltransferase
VILLLAVVGGIACFGFMMDDPYITFRYACNAAHGHGPVWNPGEHVEGYSNPLWLALLIPFAAFHADLYVVSKLLGIAFNLATIVGCYMFAARHIGGRHRWLWLLAPLLIATSVDVELWSVGGLETSLFAFLVVLFCYMLPTASDGMGAQLAFGTICFLALITRPEGAMLAPIAAAFRLGEGVFDRARLRRSCWMWLFPFLALTVLFLVWRWFFYHDLLPNAYYAKLGGGEMRIARGKTYLNSFLSGQAFALAVVALGLVLPMVRRHKAFLALIPVLLAFGAFVVYTGGDWMPAFRFCVPVMPVLYLALAMALAGLLQAVGRRALYAVLPLIAIVVIWTIARNSVVEYIQVTTKIPWIRDVVLKSPMKMVIAGRRSDLAAFLLKNCKPGDLVATQEAGKVPYLTPELRYLDVIGLNDRHIARRVRGMLHSDPGDVDYVLMRRPDWLAMWVNVNPDGIYKWAIPSVAYILNDPRTRKLYRIVAKVPTPRPGERWSDSHVFWIYRRVTP